MNKRNIYNMYIIYSDVYLACYFPDETHVAFFIRLHSVDRIDQPSLAISTISPRWLRLPINRYVFHIKTQTSLQNWIVQIMLSALGNPPRQACADRIKNLFNKFVCMTLPHILMHREVDIFSSRTIENIFLFSCFHFIVPCLFSYRTWHYHAWSEAGAVCGAHRDHHRCFKYIYIYKTVDCEWK